MPKLSFLGIYRSGRKKPRHPFDGLTELEQLSVVDDWLWKRNQLRVSAEQLERMMHPQRIVFGVSNEELEAFSSTERLPVVLGDVEWIPLSREGQR